MTIQWSNPIPHDGSPECPADARNVPCMIDHCNTGWIGGLGLIRGAEWLTEWSNVTAYRIPIAEPSMADELAEAVQAYQDATDKWAATGTASNLREAGLSRIALFAVLAKYRGMKE